MAARSVVVNRGFQTSPSLAFSDPAVRTFKRMAAPLQQAALFRGARLGLSTIMNAANLPAGENANVSDKIKRGKQRAKLHIQTVERTLTKKISSVDQKVETIKAEFLGPSFEDKIKDNYDFVFGDYVGDSAEVLHKNELIAASNISLAGGDVTTAERKDALGSDLVGTQGYLKHQNGKHLLVAECSVKVEMKDIERAKRRAKLWARIYRESRNRMYCPLQLGGRHRRRFAMLQSRKGL